MAWLGLYKDQLGTDPSPGRFPKSNRAEAVGHRRKGFPDT
jgi:hypothetical protein